MKPICTPLLCCKVKVSTSHTRMSRVLRHDIRIKPRAGMQHRIINAVRDRSVQGDNPSKYTLTSKWKTILKYHYYFWLLNIDSFHHSSFHLKSCLILSPISGSTINVAILCDDGYSTCHHINMSDKSRCMQYMCGYARDHPCPHTSTTTCINRKRFTTVTAQTRATFVSDTRAHWTILRFYVTTYYIQYSRAIFTTFRVTRAAHIHFFAVSFGPQQMNFKFHTRAHKSNSLPSCQRRDTCNTPRR